MQIQALEKNTCEYAHLDSEKTKAEIINTSANENRFNKQYTRDLHKKPR